MPGRVGEPPGEDDPFLAPGGPDPATEVGEHVRGPADDEEVHVVRGPADRLHEERQPLAVELMADEKDDNIVRAEPVPLSRVGALGVCGWPVADRVDTVADHDGRGCHARVGGPQEVVLLTGEVDDDAVGAAAEPHRVAGQGEEVKGVPDHPERRVAAGAHAGEDDAVVDVDVAGEGVVVADPDGVLEAPQAVPGDDRPDRREPHHP